MFRTLHSPLSIENCFESRWLTPFTVVVMCLALLLVAGCGGSSGGAVSVKSTDTVKQTDVLQTDVPQTDVSQPVADNLPSVGSLRLMAVGDSITHGVAEPQPTASWRKPFTENLDANNCAYRMTGSQQTNFFHEAFISPHESYSSQQANHFLTGHTNSAGVNEGIFNSLATFAPDLVLLHIGTNDAISADDNPTTLSEIDQIVAAVTDSGADVLLANLIPTYTSDFLPDVDERIDDLGTSIEAYVAQLASPRVHLVDVRNGFTEALMLEDGIHPNDAGSAHIASAFIDVLLANGYCITGRSLGAN